MINCGKLIILWALGFGKGLWASRVVDCGKVTLWGKLMEHKSYFSKICLCISVPTFCLQ